MTFERAAVIANEEMMGANSYHYCAHPLGSDQFELKDEWNMRIAMRCELSFLCTSHCVVLAVPVPDLLDPARLRLVWRFVSPFNSWKPQDSHYKLAARYQEKIWLWNFPSWRPGKILHRVFWDCGYDLLRSKNSPGLGNGGFEAEVKHVINDIPIARLEGG